MHAFYFVINLRGAPVSNRQRFIFETRLRGAVISTGRSRHAHTGRHVGPHCTGVDATTYYIEKLSKFDTKKVRVPFSKLASAGVRDGARGRRGRRAQTFATTGPPR